MEGTRVEYSAQWFLNNIQNVPVTLIGQIVYLREGGCVFTLFAGLLAGCHE